MTKLVLYGSLGSPPVRAVLLTLHALDLEYEFKNVDVPAGETKTEEYLKMNPQHTIPLLNDDGHYVWDSHAIMAYIVRKFAENDALYPKDYYLRAVVDQRLHFDSGVLYANALKGFRSTVLTKEQKMAAVADALGFLEAFLDGTEGTYMVGNHLTIADFSLLANVSTINAIVPIDAEKTPKLAAWLDSMKSLPYYEEANGKGLELMKAKIEEMRAAGLL